MKKFYRSLLWLLFLSISSTLSLNALGLVGDKKTSDLNLSFDAASYAGSDWQTFDRNGDGKIDYAVKYDKKGNKLYEAFDFNYDGKMDDFYVYKDGILVRREVDTSFSGVIDLWVYIVDGIYVSGFERSTKHNGILDVVKEFGARTGPQINVSDKQ